MQAKPCSTGECAGHRSVRTLVIAVLLGLSSTGCSFFSSRFPPSAPEQRTAKVAAHCSNAWYPIADTLSVVAGATWVIHANQWEEEESQSTTTVPWGNGTATVTKIDDRSHSDEILAERVFGYGTMVLFGASAIYGFVAEAQCGALRSEIRLRTAGRIEPTSAVRADVPNEIAGFVFHAPEEPMQRACVAKQAEWKLEGTVAVCKPNSESVSGSVPAPRTRLEFQSGALARIVIVHDVPVELLNKTYDEVYTKLRTSYGTPQVERAALSDECASSLGACLKEGDRPQGARWYWPAGSIDLQLVWRDGRPWLEERYAREEALTR